MAQLEDGVVGNFLLSDKSVSPFNWGSAAGDNQASALAHAMGMVGSWLR